MIEKIRFKKLKCRMDQSVTMKFCMTVNVPKNHRYTLHWKCLIVILLWDTNTHLWIRTYGSNFRISESKELIGYTCQSSSVSQSDKFKYHESNGTELDRQAHSTRSSTLIPGCEPSHFLLRQIDRGSLAPGYS